MFDVSDKALNRIESVCSKKPDDKYFRISVNGGGCQGFSYSFSFDNKIKDDDKILNFPKVKVLIDETSLTFIQGSRLDFVEDMIGSYFKITNPNATSTCGCGTSFSV